MTCAKTTQQRSTHAQAYGRRDRASVDYATESAHIHYLPPRVSHPNIRHRVNEVAIKSSKHRPARGKPRKMPNPRPAWPADDPTAPADRRHRALDHHSVLSMGHDFGLIPRCQHRRRCIALDDPRAGLGRLALPAPHVEGCASMRTPTWTRSVSLELAGRVHLQRVVFVFGWTVVSFEVVGCDHHLDHGRQVPRSQGQDPGRRSDPQAAQPPSQDRPHRTQRHGSRSTHR